jgi:hypothetical protein
VLTLGVELALIFSAAPAVAPYCEPNTVVWRNNIEE